jgi:hypothetical protein
MNGRFLPLKRTTKVLLPLLALGLQACTTTRVESRTATGSGITSEQLAAIITSVTSACTNRSALTPQDALMPVPQVFVETLLFELPKGASLNRKTHQLDAVTRHSDIQFFASPHVIATLDSQASMQIEQVYYPAGATAEPGLHFAGMTLRPSLGSPDALLLDLDIELQRASPAAAPSPIDSVHVRNVFAAKDRQATSMVAAVPGPENSSVAVIVVPYLLRSQADLRDHFACKMQRAREQRTAAR